MNPALEKLAKYLRLEIERGFDNRAIVGGLHRMLDPWEAEARDTDLPESLIDVVISRLRDYPQLSENSRKEALVGLVRRLQSEFPDLTFPPISKELPLDPTDQTTQTETAAQLQSTVVATDEPQPTLEADTIAPAVSKPEYQEDEQPQPKVADTIETKEPSAALSAPLTTIAGIGPKSAKTLRKLDLETLGDLLWHLPRRYDDYSQLKTINRLWYGEEVTIIGTVDEINLRVVRDGRMKLIEATVSDGTGSMRVTWFNQPWIADRLKPGRPVVLSGKVDQYLGRLTMNSPEWELLERKQLHTNRIVPVYPLTAGVSSKWLRRVIHSVVNRLAPQVLDPLPISIRESAQLMVLSQALQQIHFPDNWDLLHAAQHRLAFDEMFMLQLGVLRQKREWEQLSSSPLLVEDSWIESFKNSLPYTLTQSQETALQDIRTDLASPKPMNRLLQGDVGSGKTVIAAAAIGITARNGAQSAIMAPTSILAEQHHLTLLEILPASAGIPKERIGLLLGATPEKEKQSIREGLSDGSLQVVVGTHALLEEPVAFARLGLAIIDEQHRFGVEQRATLREKGDNPNLLVMTATPIPRSLALTIYGDLDLSVIDEMPPGRIPIKTQVMRPKERTRAHQFLITQIEGDKQAFIIYPLVEGSEKIQTKAAVDEHQKLQEEVFPNFDVGLLHGRMRPEEKEKTMSKFRAGELDALVSTSVVEVGVDIPNATVMLIEGANRFGLAQLHQFRGRVGRGHHPSYCLLIPDTEDDADNERLNAMEATNDGFKLAELDLEQRGPGDFLGTRQSGFAELRTAQITDLQLIEKARKHAKALFASDPNLIQPEHKLLAQEMDRFWTSEKGEMS
ncbi:MAG: ATP-dependent DNA helicase RecG [Anaerolineales bacterium]|nr:ATP-dependent DNA helicase RecG [Anaerolineales bacterium]